MSELDELETDLAARHDDKASAKKIRRGLQMRANALVARQKVPKWRNQLSALKWRAGKK